MSSLNNPMRFSLATRRIDVGEYLRHDNSPPKVVTDIECRPSEGTLYVHWEPAGTDDGEDTP